jgi:hypothetical protein
MYKNHDVMQKKWLLHTILISEDLRAKTADPQIFQRQLATPINLQLILDLIQVTLCQSPSSARSRNSPGNININTGEIRLHKIMAGESTQGDTHDKAWEKAEKKFSQYVETFHSLIRLRASFLFGFL